MCEGAGERGTGGGEREWIMIWSIVVLRCGLGGVNIYILMKVIVFSLVVF